MAVVVVGTSLELEVEVVASPSAVESTIGWWWRIESMGRSLREGKRRYCLGRIVVVIVGKEREGEDD